MMPVGTIKALGSYNVASSTLQVVNLCYVLQLKAKNGLSKEVYDFNLAQRPYTKVSKVARIYRFKL